MSNNSVSSNLPFRVGIVWGSASYRHDVGNQPEEYAFATRNELDAFLLGVDESNGFLGYEKVDPNSDGTWPELKHDEDYAEDEEK